MSRPLAVAMAAFALALAAKDGRCRAARIGAERLVERAARELPDDDGLRAAIDEFHLALKSAPRMSEMHTAQAGHDLLLHLSMFAVPVPPGQERADLYG